MELTKFLSFSKLFIETGIKNVDGKINACKIKKKYALSKLHRGQIHLRQLTMDLLFWIYMYAVTSSAIFMSGALRATVLHVQGVSKKRGPFLKML